MTQWLMDVNGQLLMDVNGRLAMTRAEHTSRTFIY